MIVNKIPMLVTVSENINLVTCEVLPSRHLKWIGVTLDNTINMYRKHGFYVKNVHADTEFAGVEDLFLQPITPSM